MKRTCKHVDITSLELIVPAVYECFRPYKKRHRARKLANYHEYTCAVACEKFLRRVGAEITYRIAFNSTRYAEN